MEIKMRKITCVILGLAFLALGILGITGIVTMFKSDQIYVNIGEIVLGALGLLVGVFARQNKANKHMKAELYQQGKDINQQRKDINQQRKDFDQQEKKMNENKKIV